MSKARAIRRSFPIRAYVGPNGGGKSLAMVHDALPSLAAGRRIVSTVRILDGEGNDHPLWVPLSDFRTLLEVEHCEVLLDEVTGVASSRSASNTIPPAILNLLMQLRRRDVTLSLTAPAWNRAEKVIREVTQAVTLCQGYLPESSKADDERMWRPKRAFFWRTYDAFTFDEWSTAKRERIRPVARQVFWRPGSLAQRSYDTFDQVLSVAAVTDAGACVDCGGTRTRPKCACPPASASLEAVARSAVLPPTEPPPAGSSSADLASPGKTRPPVLPGEDGSADLRLPGVVA